MIEKIPQNKHPQEKIDISKLTLKQLQDELQALNNTYNSLLTFGGDRQEVLRKIFRVEECISSHHVTERIFKLISK